MSKNWWLFVGLGIVLGILAIILVSAVLLSPHRKRRQRAESIRRAEESFHRQREWLEVRFLKLASQSGKPRGLRWVDCGWEDQVAFARDRQTQCLRAFVGVTIQFEAVEGGIWSWWRRRKTARRPPCCSGLTVPNGNLTAVPIST